jgi:hypothetical protein
LTKVYASQVCVRKISASEISTGEVETLHISIREIHAAKVHWKILARIWPKTARPIYIFSSKRFTISSALCVR